METKKPYWQMMIDPDNLHSFNFWTWLYAIKNCWQTVSHRNSYPFVIRVMYAIGIVVLSVLIIDCLFVIFLAVLLGRGFKRMCVKK